MSMFVPAEKLSDVMEFDHVIRVHPDGTVSEPHSIYAPECYDTRVELPWRLMTGYTGQDGYHGPNMHPSEFIGGRMAEDILSTPGLYVAVVDTTLEGVDEDGDENEDDDVIGWCVAYQYEDES